MKRAALLVALALGPAAHLRAQCAPMPLPTFDTLGARSLPPIVVVTAERTSRSLQSSVAAITRIEAAELARTPRATLADLLRRAPGFGLVDFDGLGFDPQVMVRGFYGGGEAEYVIVMVDGKPVHQVQNGIVAWDLLPPLAAIEAVEVVRGGASSLYGDGAVAGVINVLTRDPPSESAGTRLRGEAAGGSAGTWRAAAELLGSDALRGLAVNLGLDRTGGWREHAERTSGRLSASLPLVVGSGKRLDLRARGHWRDYDEPGPLHQSLYAADRRDSDALFRFDHTEDWGGAVTLEGGKRIGALPEAGRTTRLTARAGLELRAVDAVRTLILAPGFGDTQNRAVESNRLTLGSQLETRSLFWPGHDGIVLGFELSNAEFASRYYSYGQFVRGNLLSQDNSSRRAAALYAEYAVEPVARLRFVAGARVDYLRDHFTPEVGSSAEERTSHSAVSPRAGLNFRYQERATSAGNAWLAVGRSFKAPTLDQLYDQRRLPGPVPGSEFQTSNPDLEPQHGTSIEGGVYQRSELGAGVLLTGTLSLYQMSMRDELDFDVQSFKYVNLGRSRHRGFEAGMTLEQSRGSAFLGYTLQDAVSRSGANAGKRLKAIPRHTLHGGLSVAPVERVETGLLLTRAVGVFLDDANSVRLPGYTRVDAQASLAFRGMLFRAEVRNLFNARYASSGFLDPSGSGESFFYPAAGRVVELGLRFGF